MSSAQKRLFVIENIQQENTTYNIPIILKIQGKIDLDKMQTAVNKLGERHEPLRTHFKNKDEKYLQVIEEKIEIPLVVTKENSVDSKMILEKYMKPFQLDKAPLMRTVLIQETEDLSYLFLDIHHIVSDGATVPVILEDLMNLYMGKELPTLRIQYKDYSAWANSLDITNQEAFWLEEFEDNIPSLDLVTDFPRQQFQSYNGKSISIRMDDINKSDVTEFCAKTSTTEYVFMLAAFQLFLSKHCRQSDVVVGTPSSGRNNAELQNMVGMFVNTLVIASKINPEMSCEKYVSEVREKFWKILENQDYPFEELVKKLVKEREPSRNPLFDIMFAYQKKDELELQFDDAKASQVKIDSNVAKFDITLTIEEEDDSYVMNWEFCTDLFREESIMWMAKHFQKLLENILKYPSEPVSSISMVTDKEYTMVLEDFNQTYTDFPREKTIVQVFEEVVLQYGSQQAISFENQLFTYEQLNHKANQLACKLRQLGVKPDDVIAITVGRNMETIIGLLAILKAGGAYLPIDLTFPEKRINYMVEDCNCKLLLLGKGEWSEQLHPFDTIVSLYDAESYCGDGENPVQVNKPNDLAYVNYTSGTSGMPKGVMVSHLNVLRLVLENPYINFKNISLIPTGALTFDASTFDIWGPLLNGGKMNMVNENTILNPALLKQAFLDTGTNTIFLTTQLFNQMVLSDITMFDTLTYIITGGELMSEHHADLLKEHNHNIHLINAYGPTETTTFATTYDTVAYGLRKPIPIGKPISNTKIYIMDGDSLCGVHMSGELCIAGEGVARGYVNQKELTSQKFSENPFVAGERLYRSGDLARWTEDGFIEFLGRIDQQVKIRGFRIELQEIERQIKKMVGVKDVCVIVKERNNSKYLCAYVIEDGELSIEKLTEELSESLPNYMIPSAFVKLDYFPMNSNAKLDKRKLPEPELKRQVEYEAPKNERESCVAAVFSEVLSVEEIGLEDNFFEVGGDSIKAIRIVSKLREKGYVTNVRNILQGKTVRVISRQLELLENQQIDQNEVTGKLRCTPIQREFFAFNLAKPNHFNQAFMLKSATIVDKQKLEKVVHLIMAHHDILRTAYQGGELVIQSSKEMQQVEVEEYTRTNLEEHALKEEVNRIAQELQCSLDISQGRLLKAAIFHSANGDYVFLCIHHLVVDGISWRIILEDLSNLYTAIDEKAEVKLPQKTLSYQQWSEKLYEYSKSFQLKQEYDYWITTEQLVKAGRLVETVSDKPGELISTDLFLSEQETEELLYHANQAYNTEINDLLLTALFRAMHTISGKSSLAINLEGHGREEIAEDLLVERTVGWFTSIYPVAVKNVGRTIEEDLVEVKESIHRIPNRGIGYGVIKHFVDGILEGVESDVTFNYLGVMSENQEQAQFTICDMPKGEDIAKENRFSAPISINSVVVDKKLEITVTYENAVVSDDMAERLQTEYLKELKDLIQLCINKEQSYHTASDYGELEWSNEEFQQLVQKLEDRNDTIHKIFPMTALQEGMLFHKIEDDDATSYVVQSFYKIEEKIDPQKLNDAFDLLSQKHQMLRMSIQYRSVKEPRQVILKNRKIEFQTYDFVAEADKMKRFAELKEQDLKRGFDLEEDSLMRAAFIQMEESVCYLGLGFHHIIMDGWCMSIVINDLLNFYRELSSGKEKEELEVSLADGHEYEDYFQYMKKQEKEKALDYWGNLLDGYNVPIDIHASLKEKKETKEVKRAEVSLKEEETKCLEEICSKYGITMNTIVEAAWGILLQRYNNSKDVVFGKVVSGRNVPINGIENMVGLFINTIPVRVSSEAGQTMVQLVQSLQKQAIESAAFDYCSLVEIQSKSILGGNLIRTMLAFENYFEQNSEEKNSIKMELMDAREETNYPLSLSVYQDKCLHIGMLYDVDIYYESEVLRVLNQLRLILQQCIQNPENPVNELNLLEIDEYNKILNEFNDTATAYPSEKSLVELFEEQVFTNSEKAAVVFGDQKVTYEELNKRANKVARKLLELGVESEDYVGIWAESSIEMIAGVLGIIKAGAAYVPLDPKYPMERLKYIVNDCGCKVILVGCQTNTCEEIGVSQLLIADTEDELDDNLECKGAPDSLAYLIYTSGTTGEPKGVMVEHKNIIRLVKNTNYVCLNNQNLLQTGSLSFDASTYEIWGTLLNGNMLCLINKDDLSDIQFLKTIIRKNKINNLFITTALFNQVVATDVSAFESVEQLFFGGEATSEEHVRIFLANNKKTKLANVYGPTESTTFATYYPITQDSVLPKTPIGKPISNTKAYILNQDTLCGIGMIGELCLGGDGLARGYLNKLEITNKKFVPNPFVEGEMLYRTGDLACFMEDGNIEFLGRIDEQIKIRGFRIELGEIENRLRELPDIKDAVARVLGEGEDRFICGYILADKEVNTEEVKQQLAKVMPSFMIPAYFMQVEEFKLNKNGKIEKNSLPLPDKKSSKPYIAPRNEDEKRIAAIFEDILKQEQIGIDDDFFELGGHSLKAARFVNMLQAKTGVRVSLKEVMNAGTVRKIAQALKQGKKTIFAPIPRLDERERYEASSVQKRMYVINKVEGDSISYNIPDVMLVKGKLDYNQLQTALNELVERHEILRTYFVMEEGEVYQKIQRNVEVPFAYEKGNMEDLNTVLEEFVKPFDLNKAPLMRVKVLETAPDEAVILMDLHHIIFDGASSSILLDELSKLYNHEILSEVTVQYKDFSAWEALQDMKPLEEYWQKEFEERVPALELITDFPRPNRQSYHGKNFVTKLGAEYKTAVKDLRKITGATEFGVFLTTFMVLLNKYSRQENIVVGTPVAGRVHPDTENMIGMFVNTLPIKGSLVQNETFAETLKGMNKKCLDAIEHQQYPLEKLIEELHMERDFSRNPLFDVVFAYQNNEEGILTLGDCTVESLPADYTISKFDITLSMREVEDGYELNWEYCTDLFKESTILRMAQYYENLIQDAFQNPNKTIEQLNVLTKENEASILSQFCGSESTYPKDKTVVELFEEQVRLCPDSIAVQMEEEYCTYKELSEASDSVAAALQRAEVKENAVVAIVAERTIKTIVGIIGILKTGAAYLPIDPKYPEHRIKYILEDSSCSVVLTGEEKLKNMNLDGIRKLSLLDSFANDAGAVLKPVSSTSDSLCYIMYTSGTTGEPKGVMIQQKGVIRLVKNTNYSDFKNAHILQLGALTFDAFTFELWGCILNGGCMHIIQEETVLDPAKLKQVIVEQKINFMFITGALFNQFVTIDTSIFASIDKVMSGGEAASKYHFRKFLQENQHTELYNIYGPTECTTFATYFPVSLEDTEMRIPIGKPISNTTVYVMNHQKLCGTGIPGELCIGGDGVALGYLNREQLTNEKFTANPYNENEIIYHSGDLVYWREDGNIEYLGRIDSQVKIHGFRIELGEIENVIKNQPLVSDACVMVHETGENKNLCAYLAVSESVDIQELKVKLAKELPDYMIPKYILLMDKLPITQNGKVDKKKLIAPKIETNAEYIAPENESERMLQKAFEEVLNVKPVSVTDNFFELGGDSIKAIRIIAKIRDMGYEISMREIIKNKTIRSISSFLEEAIEDKEDQQEIVGEAAFIPIQKEFMHYHLAEPHHFNQSFLLECRNIIDIGCLKQALNTLVAHHDMLRAVICDTHYYIKSASESNLYDLNYIEYSSVSDENEIAERIGTQSDNLQRTMDLNNGPLVKAVLFHFKKKDYLFMCIHHMVVDGVSWRIILEDLSKAYLLYKDGKDVTLPKKTTPFKKWSEVLEVYREHMTETELEYWKNTASGIANSKLDKNSENRGTVVGDKIITLGSQETKELLYKANQAYETEINDLLLASLFMAVSSVTGKKYVSVNLEGHGREMVQKSVHIERTVGWFTTVYPVTMYLKSNAIAGTIQEVKATLHGIPNNGLGYGVLKYAGTDVTGEAEPDITFNYLGEFGEEDKNSMFAISSLPHGDEVSDKNVFGTPISINGSIMNKTLTFIINYDKACFDDVFMESLAVEFKKVLLQVIEHCVTNLECFDEVAVTDSMQEIEQIIEEPFATAIEMYRPLSMQKCFLGSAMGIIKQELIIEGSYQKEQMIAAMTKVIEEQPVLRSYYKEDEEGYWIYQQKDKRFDYTDLRNKSSKAAERYQKKIFSIVEHVKENVKEGYLVYLFISRESEYEHRISIIAQHSGWDKASTEILQERIRFHLWDNKAVRMFVPRFIDYVKEVRKATFENAELVNTAKFINCTKEYISMNSNKTLAYTYVALIKMGPKVHARFINNPWEILLSVLCIIAKENHLLSDNQSELPIYIMQEDRRNKIADYTNTLGAFLDLIPLLYTQDGKLGKEEVEEEIEKMQSLKKKYGINFLEYLEKSYADIKKTMPYILSINYHGLFKLTYEEVQVIRNMKNTNAAPEVYVNTYEDYLLMSIPVYQNCKSDITKAIERKLCELEDELGGE